MTTNRTSILPIARAATLLALAALVAGCSSTTGPTVAPAASGDRTDATTTTSAPASATPAAPELARAGSCWDASTAALSGWAWDGSPAVPCDGSHNAETVHVGTLPASSSAPYATVPGDYEGFVTSACGDERLSALFGAAVTSNPDFWTAPPGRSARPVEVAISYYFPNAREWASGERWFRCDAGAAQPGATTWPAVSTPFSAVLASDADTFDYCLDGVDPGSGPATKASGPVGLVAACSPSSPWQLVAVVQLRRSAKERFPGTSAAAARATRLCPSPVGRPYRQVPDAFGWNVNKITSAQCWEHRAGRRTT